jgi:Spy/CpxP family protein refolding chaperone
VDLGTIVSALKKERDQLDRAIAALEGVGADETIAKSARPATVARTAKKRRHRLTPEGRKRLSEMMKRRWAERRKKIASIRKPSKKAA